MIELSGTADAARRLMEALEASRTAPGTGVTSETREPVPPELAQAFRALVEGVGSGPQEAAAVDAAGSGRAAAASAPEASAGMSAGSDLAADAAPLMSPLELYRQQFSVNMTLFESRFLSTLQGQAAGQIEETAKSSS